MLTEFFPDRLWIAQVPLRFLGIEMGTRMTVCRLDSGELWVHSPIEPTLELRQELDALGKVSFIVAPNKLHHLFVLDFLTAYPDAKLFGSPDLPQKRPDIPFNGILGDRSEPGWASEIDQVLVRGNIYFDEVVFFHQNSRTLILTDLCESAHPDSPLSFRIMGRLTGIYDRPGPPIDMKLTFRDKQAAKASLEKVMSWDFDRIIIAHGHLINSQGKEFFRQAYKFILSDQSQEKKDDK